MGIIIRLAVFFLTVLLAHSAYAQENGYLSSPAVYDDILIFSSEGDLWRTTTAGGTATRITTHVQVEANPAISPDGTTLAFTAYYDGAQEIYAMPLSGGRPKRLTVEGGGVSVRGWTPDNKILFTSSNEPGTRPRVLRLVDPSTMQVSTIPLLDATTGTFGDDVDTLYFTRFGLSLSNDNAVLYRGGRMAQLWRYDGIRKNAERLASDFGAPIKHIMYWNGRIFFVSDKDGSDNIWSMNDRGADIQKITAFTDWQLRSPSLSQGVIYYQRGADLYAYDIGSANETKIEIQLDSDRDFTRPRWLQEPLNYLEGAHIATDGQSATLIARGNVVRAFPGGRRRIELPIPDSARARSAKLGVEGKWIYAIVDHELTGEIWRFPADGRGNGEQLTNGSDAHIWKLSLSPNGNELIFDDKLGRLWTFNLNTSRKRLLETGISGDDNAFSNMRWSSAGRYLAYVTSNERGLSQVILRDLQSGDRAIVSGDKYNSRAPDFSADGNWLYFVSDRNFVASPSAPWGDRIPGPAFDHRGKIYAVQLVPGTHFPFKPENELAEANKNSSEDKTTGSEKDSDELRDVSITFEGVETRLWEVPIKPDNYQALRANSEFLFVLVDSRDARGLKAIKIDPLKPEIKEVVGNVRSFELSNDGKTLFYVTRNNGKPSLALVPAKNRLPDDMSAHQVRVGDWRLAINTRAEWKQQFLDAWRLHRDFAYDPALRGIDWNSIRDKYLPLVDRIGHRNELNDLLGQMSAELGILHSQIGAGDQPRDQEGGSTASLGAEYEPDNEGLRITKIYQGERALIEQLGPLLKPGIDVQVGDHIIAVDGRTIQSRRDLSEALSHKAGQEVRIEIRRGPITFSVIVTPVSAGGANQLRYRHWVETNRQAVKNATGGNIGYLHIRAMGGGDIASFVRDFYQHTDKDGLIIDVRGNRGGNIDSFIIATLLRQVWAFWESPLGGNPSTNMQQTFRGHLAVLINEGTYSDGETFAAGIKALDLAPLIGTRTAGAGIWLSDRNRLSDNGIARVAEFAQSGLDGRWLIEGQGVSPDIEVINLPHTSFEGNDAQLTAAMNYLSDKIRTEPIPKLKSQPLPPLGETGRDVR